MYNTVYFIEENYVRFLFNVLFHYNFV